MMKAGIWYDMDEKIPPQSGYYLGFKGMSMGDDETAAGYYYWNAKSAEWRDSKLSHAHYVNVIYWTEADPDAWYQQYDLRTRSKSRRQVSVAEQDAWTAVVQALEQYEIVRALTKV